ncbi:MAG: diversity-generating retroelement protein Avd [Candidatus Portnoybacteria bacterium]|nr:diversity-generating retroelement protein Avd [Candidatus Portnoybacteria bacterium]
MKKLEFKPSLVYKIYKFYLSTYNKLDKLPKKNRYSIGQKIENNILELLELINLANIQIKNLREPILHKASAKCNLLKLLIRLCYDLNLFNERQYISLESQIQEIGKMIGGWIKFARTQ